MYPNTPLSPRPLSHLADGGPVLLTLRQLRDHGVSPADAADRCAPGGPWRQILPGVFLLHPGPPTSEERLHAALMYAERPVDASAVRPSPVPGVRHGASSFPRQPGSPESSTEAMITGLAALNLHGFASAPPLTAIDRIDVLVPRTRRVRSVGPVNVVRCQVPPRPLEVTGVPVAPVTRALADAVDGLDDPVTIRRLLTEALRSGRCDATAIVGELGRARLLTRPPVMDAVESLHAEGRALAEGRLYAVVRAHGLPEPLWNVELRLPDGPSLGCVDAYWPDHAIALEIDGMHRGHEAGGPGEFAGKREQLEQLGLMVVRAEPRRLRDRPDELATVVRTALMASADREPAAHVHVLPC
ncbi:hypothetical protein [Streptomyces meridianus]|uniref:DUF559 domain-containing protein n=1 Tax=Streptomyces meridianus TaxID=2938945 RepID=A0ABT0X2E4_9ACTN|nr:hypothetical protein [Streptomyces meridianus]MCM2575989.1 hypothetical protein [Streptomyces meridianus]